MIAPVAGQNLKRDFDDEQIRVRLPGELSAAGLGEALGELCGAPEAGGRPAGSYQGLRQDSGREIPAPEEHGHGGSILWRSGTDSGRRGRGAGRPP